MKITIELDVAELSKINLFNRKLVIDGPLNITEMCYRSLGSKSLDDVPISYYTEYTLSLETQEVKP